MREIALLTEARFFAEPAGDSWYIKQIIDEDTLLADALGAVGLRATRVDWSDPNVAWGSFAGAVIRATWSYADQPAVFHDALSAIARQTTLINRLETVAWNLDKHYLADLAEGGVATIPTRFVARGTETSLLDQLAVMGCDELCIKPVISAGARHTYRVTAARLASEPDLEHTFQAVLATEDWMVQPFQRSVPLEGELAFMVFGGKCTHAVRKRPADGDFRVQDDFGGTVVSHPATAAERAFAEAVVAQCPSLPAYARVDAVIANDGRLSVMELELVEPELFLRFEPSAANLLAEAIVRVLAPEPS